MRSGGFILLHHLPSYNFHVMPLLLEIFPKLSDSPDAGYSEVIKYEQLGQEESFLASQRVKPLTTVLHNTTVVPKNS